MGHSPSVTEAGFLGLELTGLQEDVQGILKGTLLKQALALGTQGGSHFCLHPRTGSTHDRGWATLGWKGRETRHRDTEMGRERVGERQHKAVRNTQLARGGSTETQKQRKRKSGR